MIVRDECTGDEAAIARVTADAFAGKPYSDQSEPQVIERLRAAGALALSLVAVEDGAIIGHVGFSPVTLSGGDGGWFALGPVAVMPERQRAGIGSSLVRAGIERMRLAGACGIVLTGSADYYRRFDFSHTDMLATDAAPAEYFLVLPLRDEIPSGMVAFHPAFFGAAA
ncbi:GNAT family N-acetyltransferase [Agrobacterium sp. ES01]|uniref:GNAT family N-acetyltransferase n=1 Tax=Agrobacterium sp. ES01 TaxID=3420714 RepID=UPI003D0F46B4